MTWNNPNIEGILGFFLVVVVFGLVFYGWFRNRSIMEENIENQEFKLMNWKSIIIGSIIMLIGFPISLTRSFYVIVLNSNDLLFLVIVILIPIILGFTVAYMNKPIYRVGIMNGFMATLIGFIIFNLFLFLIGTLKYHNMGYFLYYRYTLFVAILILVFLGSFIGTSTKKLKIRINNRQIKA